MAVAWLPLVLLMKGEAVSQMGGGEAQRPSSLCVVSSALNPIHSIPRTAHPKPLPSPSALTLLHPSALTLLSPSALTLLSPSALTLLSPSALTLLRPSALTLLSPSALTLLRPSALTPLSPSALTLLSPSALTLLNPSALTLQRFSFHARMVTGSHNLQPHGHPATPRARCTLGGSSPQPS